MTDLERVLSVIRFEEPDYVPLLTCAGVTGPILETCHALHEGGMPKDVNDFESWCRYWGYCAPIEVSSGPLAVATMHPGISQEKWVDGQYEYVRWETGALTRQVLDNDGRYSMPEFIEFHVRDRRSWEFYKELATPRNADERWKPELAELEGRTRPLMLYGGGTWGVVRSLMGPEAALTLLYDDPEMMREIISHFLYLFENFTAPMIERTRPEIVQVWEDICYNHGMLISPQHFRTFCFPYYRRVVEVCRDCGVSLILMDSDGNVEELLPLIAEVSINGLWPFEQKCGNDLATVRERFPRFVMGGGIEKEVCNVGQEDNIAHEITSKVRPMLGKGGFFPNMDHALQPLATFENYAQFMKLLHETCGNPEGEFWNDL